MGGRCGSSARQGRPRPLTRLNHSCGWFVYSIRDAVDAPTLHACIRDDTCIRDVVARDVARHSRHDWTPIRPRGGLPPRSAASRPWLDRTHRRELKPIPGATVPVMSTGSRSPAGGRMRAQRPRRDDRRCRRNERPSAPDHAGLRRFGRLGHGVSGEPFGHVRGAVQGDRQPGRGQFGEMSPAPSVSGAEDQGAMQRRPRRRRPPAPPALLDTADGPCPSRR